MLTPLERLIMRFYSTFILAVTLISHSISVHAQDAPLTAPPKFVDLLAELANDQHCCFIIRPCELPVPTENSAVDTSTTSSTSDVPDPIEKLLSKFDCCAVRFGAVYAVQEKYTSGAIVPSVSAEEYAERLTIIQHIMDTACPSGKVGDDEYSTSFLASLSPGQMVNILGPGLKVSDLSDQQKAEISMTEKLYYLWYSKQAVDRAVNVFANYDVAQLAIAHGATGSHYGEQSTFLKYIIPGDNGVHLLFDLGDEVVKVGGGSSFNPYKMNPGPDPSNIDTSTFAETTHFAPKVPLSLAGSAAAVVIGPQGNSDDCAKALTYLYSLSPNTYNTGSAVGPSSVQNVDIAHIGDAVISDLPLPLLMYMGYPMAKTLTVPSNTPDNVEADYQQYQYPYQHRVAMLRDNSVQDLASYWSAREKSGLSSIAPINVNELPQAAQRDFINIIICDVLDEIVTIANTPQYLADPNNDVFKEEKGTGPGIHPSTILEFCVVDDRGNVNTQAGIGFFSHP